PILARHAEHLYVFQRTANYSVPARNAPIEAEPQLEVAGRLSELRESLLTNGTGTLALWRPEHPADHYDDAERRELLERMGRQGGTQIGFVFSDQATNKTANDIVSEFVREKIRAMVDDPDLAEKLVPSYPMGTKRIALDTGYYETYNRDNVTLVDVRDEPIV